MKRLGSTIARLMRLADRTLSALLMAASVTLLAAGLLWYGSPGATGSDLVDQAVLPASSAQPQGDPGNFPAPTSVTVSSSPSPPTSASFSASPSTGVSPSALPAQSPTTTQPPPSPGESPLSAAVATRVVVPSLEIDLPVVSGDISVPNQGPNQYPPCDVALYLTSFLQPGEQGTTYLYAHARDGMFLPLLTASEQQNGSSMVGSLVEVYTDDDLRYVYAITLVKRHALDFSIADHAAPGTSQLVLQTSEGPRGTVPKLQVLAELQDVLPASDAAAHPKAKPRACYNTP